MILSLAAILVSGIYLWTSFRHIRGGIARNTLVAVLLCGVIFISLYGFGVRGVGIADGVMRILEFFGGYV